MPYNREGEEYAKYSSPFLFGLKEVDYEIGKWFSEKVNQRINVFNWNKKVSSKILVIGFKDVIGA